MKFEEGYFVHSKISNYKDYRKKKFEALADDLIEHLDLTPEMKILDFGCATGGLLKVLKERGFENLKGTDISYWAIEEGIENLELEEELDYFNANLLRKDFDVIFFHDVLEHVPTVEEIKRLLGLIKVGVRIIIRLPVAMMEGDNYYFAVSRNDATHIHCHAHYWWENLFHECGLVLDTVFPGTGREGIWESLGVLARAYTKER